MCIRYSSVPLRGETVTDSRDMNTEAGWVGQWKNPSNIPSFSKQTVTLFFVRREKCLPLNGWKILNSQI